jgi:cellulose synthase/poly-beta-1,6-N-acetylglucosamine synthase-like glycosyltransferase
LTERTTIPAAQQAASSTTQAPAYRATPLPVMTGGERFAYALLTGVVLVGLVLFASFSIGLREEGSTGTYIVATLLVAYQLTAWLLRWMALPRMRRPSSPPPTPPDTRIATVTTFVPGAESLEMLELTLRALVAMDLPHDTWVLDEGDEAAVRALCIRHGVHHFSRKHQPELSTETGRYAAATKHGNYNAWLTMAGFARYDVIVSFDPDHVPERHYLTRTIGYFADPEIGYVQVPQVYYNQDASWIARGAAEETYDYYSAHQMVSYGLGHPIVVGSHTAHRVAALQDIGGFAVHDADDLLATLLYRGAGWRGVYVPETLAVGLTPTSWSVYMGQQARWTRSVLDIKLRSFPDVAGQLPLIERLIGVLHGIFYLRALTIPVAFLILAWLIGTRGVPAFISPPALLALSAFGILLTAVGFFRQRFYLNPERERGLHWRAVVLQFAKWPAQLAAIWQAARGTRVDYAITLKVISPSGRELVLWPHLAAAVLLAEAWVFGALLEPPISAVRTTLAAMIMVASSALAWSETWSYPSAFDPEVYRRYRARRDAAP